MSTAATSNLPKSPSTRWGFRNGFKVLSQNTDMDIARELSTTSAKRVTHALPQRTSLQYAIRGLIFLISVTKSNTDTLEGAGGMPSKLYSSATTAAELLTLTPASNKA